MKPVATYQKLRGGYYTPKPIADFLAQWAIQTPTTNVLEPSCGDGVLLKAAVEALLAQGANKANIPDLVYGIELDPQEAQKALDRLQALPTAIRIHIGDFFAYCQRYLYENTY